MIQPTLSATTSPASNAAPPSDVLIRSHLRSMEEAYRGIAEVMHDLAQAASGTTDAGEAAWYALEDLPAAFEAVAAHLTSPDALSRIMGGQYQVGYEAAMRYAATVVRHLGGSAKYFADTVANAQAGKS